MGALLNSSFMLWGANSPTLPACDGRAPRRFLGSSCWGVGGAAVPAVSWPVAQIYRVEGKVGHGGRGTGLTESDVSHGMGLARLG